MSSSKHHHNHYDPDLFMEARPISSDPSRIYPLSLPLPRARARTRTPSPSSLLRHRIYDNNLRNGKGKHCARISSSMTGASPLYNSRRTSSSEHRCPSAFSLPSLNTAIMTTSSNSNNVPPQLKLNDEDNDVAVDGERWEENSVGGGKRMGGRRRGHLLSDSEISVLDLGPSLSPEDQDSGVGPSIAGPQQSRFYGGAGVGHDGQQDDGRVSVRSMKRMMMGCHGRGSNIRDHVDAIIDAEPGYSSESEFDYNDCGYARGYGIESQTETPRLALARYRMAMAQGHWMEHGLGIGGHGGENEGTDRETTVASPMLLPLRTSRYARRGISGSRAFGI